MTDHCKDKLKPLQINTIICLKFKTKVSGFFIGRKQVNMSAAKKLQHTKLRKKA